MGGGESQRGVKWVACRLRQGDQVILVCDGPVCFRVAILGFDKFVHTSQPTPMSGIADIPVYTGLNYQNPFFQFDF